MSCQQKRAKKVTETKMPVFENILDSFQLKGSILIFDNAGNTFFSNDYYWANERNLPASTFKIPNSIIALETGVIQSDTTTIKWNGEKRRLAVWEQDLTFKKAFQVSCVPCYQEIARKIGVDRMKAYLEKFGYGEMIFDSLTLDKFWLEGSPKISQFEQISFLRRFYFSELPVSERTVKIVKNILEVEKTDTFTFSGKTGWGVRSGKNNGWYVGFLETKQNVYFFATNVVPKEGLNIDNFAAARTDATRAAFKALGLME
jgi:beta-lactamase class D